MGKWKALNKSQGTAVNNAAQSRGLVLLLGDSICALEQTPTACDGCRLGNKQQVSFYSNCKPTALNLSKGSAQKGTTRGTPKNTDWLLQFFFIRFGPLIHNVHKNVQS